MLVDRIAEVLRAHGDGPFINADCTGAGCECGWTGGQDDSWFTHVAERIAVLFTEELVDLRQFLQKAEECVYANVGPSPVLVEIRAAQTWANSWITAGQTI